MEDEFGENDREGGGGGFDGFDEGDGDVFEGDEAEDYGEAAEDSDDGHVAYKVKGVFDWFCGGGGWCLFGGSGGG